MTLRELQAQRAEKTAEMRSLNDKAANDNRDLNDDERKRFDALDVEVRSLSDRITRTERIDALERTVETRSDERGDHGPDLSRYSVAKAVQQSSAGHLDGIEREVHEELSRGRAEVRGVMVPTEVLLEHRAIKTTTPGAGPGGNLVGRQMMPVTEHPRPALLVESMNATVMRNLVGNVDLPRLSESGTVGWVAEHTDVTRSDPKFSKTSLTPRTVGGEYELSRRMILQSSTAIEDLLRRDLGYLLRQALDGAAINGAGGVEPTGLLNVAGVEKIAATTVDSDTTADLIAALELDDITGTAAFLTNATVMAKVRKTKDGDGHVIPASDIFHGLRHEATSRVPATLGAGTASALIYGLWSELVIGYWSGVDILTNPYHADVASKGGVLIHSFLDADVAVREPKAFAWAEIA